MNTVWRALFALYLLFLVPGWIRDVSKAVKIVEDRISIWINAAPNRVVPILQASLVTLMFCANIALQFILK